MKRRYQRILIIIALLVLGLCFSAVSIADAGNFTGGDDWGGSSSGSSDWGSSDWGSSSSGSSDWSYGGWSSGSSSGDDLLLDSSDRSDDDSSMLWGLLFIAIVIFVVVRYKKSKKQTQATNLYQAADEGPGLPLETLKQKDPNFNEQTFLERVGNEYVQMQDAWESKNWEPMRAFMTDSLYQQMGRQLDELKKANQTNHVDRISVLDASIRRYAQEGDNDVLVVRLSTRICDYTTDDNTGSVVRGNQNKELYMTYDWKLIRQKDQLTQEQSVMTVVNCPNCGAPLEVNQTGKCPYCGSVITLSEHDWALSVIKGISQRSGS